MMNNPELAVTLRSLIENEIPDGRGNPESNCSNLGRVAAYCKVSYVQAQDKKATFDETRRYIMQSLASVAYQMDTLSYVLLRALDLQFGKISSMASQLSRSSTMFADHYRTPQIATTPVINLQRFSTVTHGSQNNNNIPNKSNYDTISRKSDSQQSMSLPLPQLASVAQYRLSANNLDGLPPLPISVMMDDEPLPPSPMQAAMTPIYESTLSDILDRRTVSHRYDSSYAYADALLR
ncbi:abl-interactor 1 [Loa loa]|uniref:Abl-interactor 1 n=2 Tax=Loa loa TaxID=7209 RepID=A0A1S0TMF3_LOALO|nr:abl-interactor 1 [Loa loa]EFO16459.1 abl-interactor 1 [Loa loa]